MFRPAAAHLSSGLPSSKPPLPHGLLGARFERRSARGGCLTTALCIAFCCVGAVSPRRPGGRCRPLRWGVLPRVF